MMSKQTLSNQICDNSTVISSYKGSKIAYNLTNFEQKNLGRTMKVTCQNGIEDLANFNFKTSDLHNSSSTATEVQAPEVL